MSLQSQQSRTEKAREFQKNIYFCFLDYAKAFDCVNHNKLWKILRRGSQGASRAAPWKSGHHERGEGERVIVLGVSSSHQVAKVLEFQLQLQSFQ